MSFDFYYAFSSIVKLHTCLQPLHTGPVNHLFSPLRKIMPHICLGGVRTILLFQVVHLHGFNINGNLFCKQAERITNSWLPQESLQYRQHAIRLSIDTSLRRLPYLPNNSLPQLSSCGSSLAQSF